MTRRTLLACIAAALFAAPLGLAHPFPLPFQQCGPQATHHYAAAASVNSSTPVASLSWRTTVVLLDSCGTPQDGEGDFGIGGGFLPADHHQAYTFKNDTLILNNVCVRDQTGTTVFFWIGTIGASGQVTTTSNMLATCGPLLDSSGNLMAPGIDGGWWIFLANREQVEAQSRVFVPPTVGHICIGPGFPACP